MKKLITLTCVALSAVFAVMLANADDTQSGGGDMGGTMGETTPTQPSDTTMGEPSRPSAPMTDEKQAMSDRWKNAKTCTDEGGKTYRRGKPGFKACVDEMRRKEQMGGMMGQGTTESAPGTGTSDSVMGSGDSGTMSDTSESSQ